MRLTPKFLLTAALSVGLGQSAFAVVVPVVLPDSTPQVVNVEDDSGLLNNSNWFIFSANAGDLIDIDINRLAAPPDLCADLYFGDVTGVDFGAASADCFAAEGDPPLMYLFSADDTEDDAFGGPFGDPRFTFTADFTGIYSISVTSLNNAGIGELFEVIATGVQPIGMSEPSILALLGLGLLGLGLARRRV